MYQPLKRIDKYIEYVLVRQVSLPHSVVNFSNLTTGKYSTTEIRHQREGTRGQHFRNFYLHWTCIWIQVIQIFHHQSTPEEHWAFRTFPHGHLAFRTDISPWSRDLAHAGIWLVHPVHEGYIDQSQESIGNVSHTWHQTTATTEAARSIDLCRLKME